MKLKRRSKANLIEYSTVKKRRKINVEFLSTGCVLFNLSVTSNKDFGIPRGRVTNLVGDGSSGKTLVCLEIAFNFIKSIYSLKSKNFEKVKKAKVIYNNSEGVMDFPLEKMYGKNFESLITWKRSETIESAGRDYLNEANKLKKHESLLYIIDSWDAFKSIHDSKIREEKDENIVKGFNLKKQQFSWHFFQESCDLIDKNRVDATLIVVSQTKQKIGVTFGKKKYRTGGDALNFYTHLVAWLREDKKLEKVRSKEKRAYGIISEVKIERSKVSKPYRTGKFRVLFDYGIDNVGSMGDYLKNYGRKNWKNISLKDIHSFSKQVEERNLVEKLAKTVEKIWNKIENEFEVELSERKRKEL